MMKNFAAFCFLFFVGSARACSDEDSDRLDTCLHKYQNRPDMSNMGEFFAQLADEMEEGTQLDILCEPNKGLKPVMTCMHETLPKCLDKKVDKLNSNKQGDGDALRKDMSMMNLVEAMTFVDTICDNRAVFSDNDTMACIKQRAANATECTKKSTNAANNICGMFRAVEICSKPYEECDEKIKEILESMYKIFNLEAVCGGCVTSTVSIGLLFFSILISPVIR